jgi:hypothetical protein
MTYWILDNLLDFQFVYVRFHFSGGLQPLDSTLSAVESANTYGRAVMIDSWNELGLGTQDSATIE